MIKTAVALSLLFSLYASAYAAEPLFAVAVTATPVLNTSDFKAVFGGIDGNSLQKDNCGQLRALEFIALPGTLFTIEAELKNRAGSIFKVTSADYPYPSKSGYYIDSRSVRIEKTKPAERVAELPTINAIIATLKKRVGSRYVWGGNKLDGVAEIPLWYPPTAKANLSRADISFWKLAGVDCSGLLYEATGGFTPRNTSALINFGNGVDIAGKSRQEIAVALKPLDLIVWPGHVLIVIDGGNVIESRLVCAEPDKGVRIRPSSEALRDIMKQHRPVDSIRNSGKEFVVRRWYLQQ